MACVRASRFITSNYAAPAHPRTQKYNTSSTQLLEVIDHDPLQRMMPMSSDSDRRLLLLRIVGQIHVLRTAQLERLTPAEFSRGIGSGQKRPWHDHTSCHGYWIKRCMP